MNKYSNFKILIVDDNHDNLYTLRQLIEKHMDARVLEADSGKRAIEIALENPDIDLIVLDIQMPEMDGFETASLLKIRKKTQDIPIIFLTAAFKTEEFQQRGYDVGGADYLLKPIDDNQLINKLSTYFRLIEKERNLNQILEEKVEERTRELNEARLYLENIINSMGEALLILDPDGQITSANPTAYGMLGYPEGELNGMSIGDVFEEETDQQADAFMGTWLEALIRSGALPSIEARFITSDGTRVPILFSRTAIADESGKLLNIICIAKNMTGYQKIDQDN
ncbi:MAG: response regulator [Chromatiales bacterium]|jgi:PAS domain S-box-containing protein